MKPGCGNSIQSYIPERPGRVWTRRKPPRNAEDWAKIAVTSKRDHMLVVQSDMLPIIKMQKSSLRAHQMVLLALYKEKAS